MFKFSLLLSSADKQLIQRTPDGAHAELLRVDLVQRYPLIRRGIIGSLHILVVLHLTEEEEVHRGDMEARIVVHIGIAEDILRLRHLQARLFLDLAPHAFLSRLPDIREAAREVQGSFSGFFLTSEHQQLVLVIEDERCRSSTRIEIIDEAAVLAFLAFLVILHEMLTAAYRTISELF
jgi:hypothetical protein